MIVCLSVNKKCPLILIVRLHTFFIRKVKSPYFSAIIFSVSNDLSRFRNTIFPDFSIIK